MISSPQAELQKLLYETLIGNDGVMAQANDVYDPVPPKPFDAFTAGSKNGYLSFGPTQVLNDDAECITAGEHIFQIDCWSREVGFPHCKRMVDAVAAALNNKEFELIDNAFVGMSVENRQVFRDPDGLTSHGVVSLRVWIEEND